jgi:hypothetical protein
VELGAQKKLKKSTASNKTNFVFFKPYMQNPFTSKNGSIKI